MIKSLFGIDEDARDCFVGEPITYYRYLYFAEEWSKLVYTIAFWVDKDGNLFVCQLDENGREVGSQLLLFYKTWEEYIDRVFAAERSDYLDYITSVEMSGDDPLGELPVVTFVEESRSGMMYFKRDGNKMTLVNVTCEGQGIDWKDLPARLLHDYGLRLTDQPYFISEPPYLKDEMKIAYCVTYRIPKKQSDLEAERKEAAREVLRLYGE